MPLANVHSITIVPPDDDDDVAALRDDHHPALHGESGDGDGEGMSHAMSPLDAFAYTSSLLAKQLDDENRNGRRVSRLPPLAADESFMKRPGFARSQSVGPSPLQLVSTHYVPRKDVELSTTRPVTSNSRLSRIPDAFGGSPVKSAGANSRTSPLKSAASMPAHFTRPHDDRHADDILLRSPPAWQPLSARLPERRPFGPQPAEPVAATAAFVQQSPSKVDPLPSRLPRAHTFEDRPSPRLYSNPSSERPRQITAAAALRQQPARVPDMASTERSPQPPSAAFEQQQQQQQRPSPRLPILISTDRPINMLATSQQSPFDRSPRIPDSATFEHPRPSPQVPQVASFDRRPSGPHIEPSSLSVINSPTSIKSPPRDSSDDDVARSSDTSITSYSERHTESPAMSPMVIDTRPPSISSEYSLSSARQRSFNFSRPMSRASQPSLEFPSRQQSADSHYSDSLHTPISVHSMDFRVEDEGPAPSYIYSSYSLPRGRALQRNSIIFQPLSFHQEFLLENSSSIMSRPPMSTDVSGFKFDISPKTSLEESPGRYGLMRSNTEPPLPTSPYAHVQAERKRSVASASLSSSQNTVRAHSIAPSSSVDTMSADDHVELGISRHENGSVKESTYHLRKAAMMNHPTGMLLYALACRHGWGMKPDPATGISWLRKAVTCAGYELAELGDIKDGTPGVLPPGPTNPSLASKGHRARFALGIYELGVSHLNGWGVEADKPLALRCFEIAGEWGDADALSEAGFCYAQGIGCKKDLKRAAHFYREAEKKGVTMVGNSWIHKKKYDSPSVSPENSPKKSSQSDWRPSRISEESRNGSIATGRSKSMTRRLFSRKKSFSSNVSPPVVAIQPY